MLAVARFARRHSTFTALVLLLGITAAVRMPFWLSSTYAYGHGDAIIWEVWSRAIYEHGFINVFRTADSNNVGYHYVLWPTGEIYGRWFSSDFELWTAPIRVLIKIPPFVCDLGLAAVVFFAARSLSSATTEARRHVEAGAAAAAFALAPATVYDSMWWSQIDSVITLCMAGSALLVLRGRPGAGWAVWMVGFLFKPQPIVILPVLAAFTLWKFGPRALARGVACAVVVGAAALAPFLLHGDAGRIGGTYQTMFQQDPIDLAEGAWNGWSIYDLYGDDPVPADAAFSVSGVDVSYATLSLGMSAAAAVFVLAYLRRHLDEAGLLAACAAMVFVFYMLPTSTHERYLYPMFAFAAPLLVRHRQLIAPYALLSVTFMLNLLAINPPNASDFWQWHETALAVSVASVNLAMFALMVGALIVSAAGGRRAASRSLLPLRDAAPTGSR